MDEEEEEEDIFRDVSFSQPLQQSAASSSQLLPISPNAPTQIEGEADVDDDSDDVAAVLFPKNGRQSSLLGTQSFGRAVGLTQTIPDQEQVPNESSQNYDLDQLLEESRRRSYRDAETSPLHLSADVLEGFDLDDDAVDDDPQSAHHPSQPGGLSNSSNNRNLLEVQQRLRFTPDENVVIAASVAEQTRSCSRAVAFLDASEDEEEEDLFDTPCAARRQEHKAHLPLPAPLPNMMAMAVKEKSQVQSKMEPNVRSKHDLEVFSVPHVVIREYVKMGVRQLYPWQKACLETPGVLPSASTSTNLVYCAPTSGGKTLVAEVILIRRYVAQKRKSLFVLPYVAVVEEKTGYFSTLLEPLGATVQCHAGKKGGQRYISGDVGVCTIEKANNIINEAIQNGKLSEIGLIVVDEAHMIDDPYRGYLLELMLTKLMFCGASLDIQIIAMSATLPNASVLATWLRDAAFFATDFRPVPLRQFCKYGNRIFDEKLAAPVREVHPVNENDSDGVVALVQEVVQTHHQALVFCATKKMCETTAAHLARNSKSTLTQQTAKKVEDDRITLLHVLRGVPGGADPTQEEAVKNGFAYHHAGLTVDERDAIETCYRRGSLHALCCTTTLAAGVNLPARRVIFRSPRIGASVLDVVTYRQAAGRAGRAGLDTFGESYLIVAASERELARRLLLDKLPPLRSSLQSDRGGLTRALLESFALGIVKTVYDVQHFIQCTFFHVQAPYEQVHVAAQRALQFLEKSCIIAWSRSNKVFSSSSLGAACVASSMPPEQGLIVYEELSRARERFVLVDDLHILYHVTPPVHGIEPHWRGYYSDIYTRLKPSNYKTAEAVGIDEGFLISVQQMALPVVRDAALERKIFVHRRFYVALMLQEIIHEVSICDVAAKFNISRGEVQKLMETAATFANMVATFCDKLNWWFFSGAFERVTQRLKMGVENDLLPLMKIPMMRPWKARLMYKHGLRSVEDIANASIDDLQKLLLTRYPFSTDQAMHQAQVHELRSAKLMVKGAKLVLHSDALEMQESALEITAKGISSSASLTFVPPSSSSAFTGVLKRSKTEFTEDSSSSTTSSLDNENEDTKKPGDDSSDDGNHEAVLPPLRASATRRATNIFDDTPPRGGENNDKGHKV
eukprot:PhM_4_TR18031/c1_g1_i3/m.37170/K02349/POLQ; DNA polymerase theta